MKRAEVLGFIAGILLIGIAAAGYFYWKPLAPAPANPAEKMPAPAPATRAATTKPATPPAEPIRTNLSPAPVASTEESKADAGTTLTMTRTAAHSGKYGPGEPIDISLTLLKDGPDEVRALGIQELLPPGWEFVEFIGQDQPAIKRVVPDEKTGLPTLEMAWIQVPQFPLSFAYRLKASASSAGPQTIQGEAIYRMAGPEYRTQSVATGLVPRAPGEPAPPVEAIAPVVPKDMAVIGAANTASLVAMPQTPTTPLAIPAANAAPVSYASGAEGVLAYSRIAGPYTPGQPLEITLEFDYTGGPRLNVLSHVETLPAGWTFLEVEQGPNAPRNTNFVPQRGALTMLWAQPPAWPLTVKYKVNVPADATGVQQITGEAVYRTTAGPDQTGGVLTEVSPAQ